MKTEIADVVIIGGGIMGLSTAYHLVRRGCQKIVILEADETIGGRTTLSCGGGVRYQFSTSINIHMSLLSLPLFQVLAEETGQDVVFHKSGYGFILFEDDIEQFRAIVNLQHSLGVETEWYSGDALNELFPLLNIEAQAATFCKRDGFIHPQQVVQAYLVALRRLNVTIYTDSPVNGIQVDKGQVSKVTTSRRCISTPVVVNAAGPWSAYVGHLAQVTIPVTPILHQCFVCEDIPQIPSDFPTLIFPSKNIGLRKEGRGLLVGSTLWQEKVNLDRQEVNACREKEMYKLACQILPTLSSYPIKSSKVGLYEVTPDLHPIIGRIPEVQGFYCITGFSGHGFMHGPIAGLLLSEEILDGNAHTLDINALSIERFKRDDLLVEKQIL